MSRFSVSDLAQKTPASSDTVAAFLGNAGQDDTFWGYDATGESGKFERHVLCACSWENTDTVDIGGTDMTCRAFVCVACSTYIHNYPIVRKLKSWTLDRSGNNRYAYWTTHVTASAVMSACWLYRTLTYPKRNDFASWEPSLEYAKKMANSDYASKEPRLPSTLI